MGVEERDKEEVMERGSQRVHGALCSVVLSADLGPGGWKGRWRRRRRMRRPDNSQLFFTLRWP